MDLEELRALRRPRKAPRLVRILVCALCRALGGTLERRTKPDGGSFMVHKGGCPKEERKAG